MRNVILAMVMLASLATLAGCSQSQSDSPAVAKANLGFGQPFVAAGDITGDGLNDIVFGDKDGIKLLVNTGNGKFANPVVIGSTSLGFGQPSVAIGDVTGDGRADVILGDKNGIIVLKNLGANKFEVLR